MQRKRPKYLTHDSFLKASLAIHDVAKDFFRAHLPRWLLSRVDLTSLELVPSESVTLANLRRSSDLVYKVKLRHSQTKVYLQVEHKSSIDKHVFFQHYENQVAQMLQSVRGGGDDAIPLVIPIIIYNGQTSHPEYSFIDLFDNDVRVLVRQVLVNSLPVISICEQDDDRILKHGKASVMELCMKHVHQEFDPTVFESILQLAFDVRLVSENNLLYYENIIHYYTSGKQQKNVPKLLEVVKEFIENLPRLVGGHMTTIAQALFDEGYDSGRMEGLIEGRQEGRQEGRKSAIQEYQSMVALRMMELAVSFEVISQVTGLSIDMLEQLDWSGH